MKHRIYGLLFMVIGMSAMDRHGLYKQLEHIIYNGTLEDFQQHEAVFRAQLDANTISVARQLWCDPYLDAIEEIRKLKTDPELEEVMLILQHHIQSLKSSLAGKEFSQQYRTLLQEKHSLGTAHEQKALHILQDMDSSSESLFGKSMKIMLEKLEHKSDPEQYLADEQLKVRTIQITLQQILDDEFEPESERQYNKEDDVFFWEIRQRKNQ